MAANDIEHSPVATAPQGDQWTCLGVSVTYEQKAAIRAAARRKGLNPSSWGRVLFLEALAREGVQP